MTKTLRIQAEDSVREFYENHGTFHEGDAGLDLFFPSDVDFYPGETKIIEMGIRCEMMSCTDDSCGFVSYGLYPRSSIAKTPLMLANHVGVVDASYTGTIKVALRYVPTNDILNCLNNSGKFANFNENYKYSVSRGDRLVQICAPGFSPFDMELVDSLRKTTRGGDGFGSTGK